MRYAKLVCFGNGGDSVEWSHHCRTSGYGRPENPHAAQFGADECAPDGCPVIDKRPAVDTPEGYSWAIRGPMVNVDLPDGETTACPVPSPLLAGAMAAGENEYGTLLAIHAAHDGPSAGPLDYVSISEYVAGWAAVGARIGHYADGQIVWHD